MKPQTWVLFGLPSLCLAGRWNLWKDSCSQYNPDKIKAAMADAINLAKNAITILNDHRADEKVQQMVKFILSDDPKKLNHAKDVLAGVSQYDDSAYGFLGAPFIGNDDLWIFCDASNYAEVYGKYKNKEIDAFIPQELYDLATDTCFNTNIKAGDKDVLPMAITTSSDKIDQTKYDKAMMDWIAGGSQGDAPELKRFAMPRTNKPNTLDLCRWYLVYQRDANWPKIDKDTIEKVREQSFIDGLKNNDKAIDYLSQSLSGTFLHELTHTNLGGKKVDNPSQQGCYGWQCVGALHDENNADSINMLAVAMKVWDLGYFVDNDGFLQTR